MSRNGVAALRPSRTSCTRPSRSTTNSRWLSPGEPVTWTGEAKSPTFTSAGAACAAGAAASPAARVNSRASRRMRSVVGDRAVLGLERAALAGPGLEAAGQRVGLIAAATEGVGGHRRAGADPAVEDDRALLVDRGRLRGDLAEHDVARAADPAGVPLVVLAYVDDLRVLVAPQGLGPLRRDVPFPCHRPHGTRAPARELASARPGPAAEIIALQMPTQAVTRSSKARWRRCARSPRRRRRWPGSAWRTTTSAGSSSRCGDRAARSRVRSPPTSPASPRSTWQRRAPAGASWWRGPP